MSLVFIVVVILGFIGLGLNGNAIRNSAAPGIITTLVFSIKNFPVSVLYSVLLGAVISYLIYGDFNGINTPILGVSLYRYLFIFLFGIPFAVALELVSLRYDFSNCALGE